MPYMEGLSIWVLDFSLKEETMRNIHNQNMAELAHCIMIFYTQGFVTCFCDTKILVLHWISLGLSKPSLLHLI